MLGKINGRQSPDSSDRIWKIVPAANEFLFILTVLQFNNEWINYY